MLPNRDLGEMELPPIYHEGTHPVDCDCDWCAQYRTTSSTYSRRTFRILGPHRLS